MKRMFRLLLTLVAACTSIALVLPSAHALADTVEDYYPSGTSDGSTYCGPFMWITWEHVIGRVGDYTDTTGNTFKVGMRSSSNAAVGVQWGYCWRGQLFIDTSNLPDNAVISAATLTIYGTAKQDNLSTSPSIGLYGSSSTNTAVAEADYSKGTSQLSDTVISYAGFNASGANVFTLNASGLAYISKTGYTRFVLRDVAFDVGATTPNWTAINTESSFTIAASETAGTGSDPVLSVTYTLPPPTVTTQAASGVSTTSATLNGNVTDTGGSTVTARGFQWDTDSGAPYANSIDESGSFGTGAFTGSLTNLDPGETYYFRSYATNAVGTSYGDEESFTTLAIPTVTATTTVTGNTAATLDGEVTNAGNPSTVTTRGFRWGVAPGVYFGDWHESGSFGVGSFTYDVSGLLAGYTYRIEAYATNSAGTSYSPVITMELPKVGKNMLSTMLPIATAGGVLIGTIRIALDKNRRGDMLGRVFRGLVTGGLFFIIAIALAEVLIG